MKNKITIYEFVGVPGAGKTYLANKLSNNYIVYRQNNIKGFKDVLFLLKGNYRLLICNKKLFFWLWLFFIRFGLLSGHGFNFFNKLKATVYLLYYDDKQNDYIMDQFILQYISTSALQSKNSTICKNLFKCYLDVFNVKLINVRNNNYFQLIDRLKKRKKYWDKKILNAQNPLLMLKEIEKFHEDYIKQFNLVHTFIYGNDIKKIEDFLDGNAVI